MSDDEEENHNFFNVPQSSEHPQFITPGSMNQGSKKETSMENRRDVIEHSDFYKAGIRDPGKEGRKASRLLFLRTFNNWIKAVLINKYCHLLGPNLSVLDICCGRGGDLQKFFKAKVSLYVGADLSNISLKNAMERITKIKSERTNGRDIRCKCYFITEDVSDPNNHLMEKINKEYYFDLVSCQFAMHYHFKSIENIRAFLSNVVGKLCDGGYFIGSIIDDNIIIKRLRNRKYQGNKYINEKLTFGNDFYSVRFYQKKFPVEKGPYGINYGFYLEDSIDSRDEEGHIKYVEEYLIVFNEFIKLCEEYNLYLVEKKNFTDFYQEYVKDRIYSSMFNKMIQDLDSDSKNQQWEIIQLYQVFAFQKRDKGKNEKIEKYNSYLNKARIPIKDSNPELIEDIFE